MPALATGTGGGRARWPGSRRFMFLTMVVGLLMAVIAPMASIPSQPASAQEWSPPRTVYFPDTGQSLDQVFLDYWREAGGAASYGYPITPEITQPDGTIVQYLQYARFEYYPDGNEDGFNFVLGNIGEELRPFSLQRSVASFTSTGSGDGASAAATNAEFISAWMSVDAPKTESPHIRFVPETGHTVRYSFLEFWDRTGGAAYLGNPLTEEYVVDGTTYQVFERGQVAWENGTEPWLVPVGELLVDKYNLSTAPADQGNIPTYSEDLFVPPPTPTPDVPDLPADGERWIEINLSSQYLIAWQGNVPFLETYISSGRPEFATPTGTFYINSKVPSEDMEGVIGGEYYNVPEVPDTMYFTNVGHAIHGTYWHNNFGTPMSHGCINVPLGTSTQLYEWAPVGTRVEIHY